MKHLNGDLVCAVDVETTGLDARKYDVYEVAVVPLDSQLKPRSDILPFHVVMKPGRCWIGEGGSLTGEFQSDAVQLNKETFTMALRSGADPEESCEGFERWFENLHLAEGKRIVPLGQNYAFDKAFMIEWLGALHYEHFFHYHYRDTMHVALFLNDLAWFNGNEIPFPKVSLGYLCSQLKIKNEKAHSALADAQAEAEVYRMN